MENMISPDNFRHQWHLKKGKTGNKDFFVFFGTFDFPCDNHFETVIQKNHKRKSYFSDVFLDCLRKCVHKKKKTSDLKFH